MKITYFCGNSMIFSAPIISALSHITNKLECYQVFNPLNDLDIDRMRKAWEKSDLIWWDWGNNGLDILTSWEKKVPIIVRCFAGEGSAYRRYAPRRCYEIYNDKNIPSYNMKNNFIELESIDWDKVDLLLFRSQPILDDFIIDLPNINCKFDTLMMRKYHYEEKEDFSCVASMIGRISREKDIDFILDVFCDDRLSHWELILKGYSDARGRGRTQSDLYLKNITDRLKHSKLNNIIRLERWGDPRSTYRESSLVLSSSLSEGCQNSIMEGMAMGCAPMVRNWKRAYECFPLSPVIENEDDMINSILSWECLNKENKKKLSDDCIEAIRTSHYMGGEDHNKVGLFVSQLVRRK